MRAILPARFNALAAYCRQPETDLFSDELGWFEHGDERVLGVLVRDTLDGDFGGIVFGRDRRGRFRAIGLCDWHRTPQAAEAALDAEMARLAAAPDDDYYQGDEGRAALDFFSPRVPADRLHPTFLRLAEREAFSAARGMIEPMMHWYEDPDGNFVEQFQTTAFDARIWELYLFAVFTEMGYRIVRVHAVPDFTCVGLPGTLCVEAVTVGPTRDGSGAIVPDPPRDTPEATHAYLREYMPIKYGSPLTSKLAKRYWDRPNVAGRPLIFAVHDFHASGSMIGTRSSLPVYLYGYDHDCERGENGLRIRPRKVATHRWGDKVIPSGFFELPGAENVSAVLFSNSATLSKFNRMGAIAGFGSRRVRLIREGSAFNHDPNATEPRRFCLDVNAPDYVETWVEGVDVFHNPRATRPIDPAMLAGAAHHHLLPDGRVQSLTPEWHPLASVTYTLLPESAASGGEPDGAARRWPSR